MNERQCKHCGLDVLYGPVEGWPDVMLSRWPIDREHAPILKRYGVMVVGARRLFGGRITAQFWRDGLGEEWVPLKEHVCGVEKFNGGGWK